MKEKNIYDEIINFFDHQSDLGVPIYYEKKQNKTEMTFNSKILTEKLSVIKEEFVNANSLDQLNKLICNCQKCPLGKTRKNFVFGVGKIDAEIVLIGEAPGEEEDLRGEPFVGRAGKLLTSTLVEFGFSREEVYICNILKCRPPQNRDPLPEEVNKCEPYLLKQLSIIKPKIILALGRIAGNTLLKMQETLGYLRSRTYLYNGIPLFITYHPAAILRNPNWKKTFYEDFNKVKLYYENLK